MDIKARQEYVTPTAWNPAEMVFVDNGDGTATQYVTSAGSVPRRVLGGVLAEGALVRQGPLIAGPIAIQATTIAYRIRVAAPTRLTSIALEQTHLNGLSAQARIASATGATLLTVPATKHAGVLTTMNGTIYSNSGGGSVGAGTFAVSDGGVTAALDYELQPDTDYFVGFDALDGAVLATRLSGPHTWTALTINPADTVWVKVQVGVGGINGAGGYGAAQVPFVFETGGLPVRRLAGGSRLTLSVDEDRAMFDLAPIDLGEGIIAPEALPSGPLTQGNYPALVGQDMEFRVLAPCTLLKVVSAWRNLGGLAVRLNGAQVQAWPDLQGAQANTTLHNLTLDAPLALVVGDVLGLRVLSATVTGGDVLPMGARTVPINVLSSLDTAGGVFRWTNPHSDGWAITFGLVEGALLRGVLPAWRVGGLVAFQADVQAQITALSARVTTLEQAGSGPALDSWTYTLLTPPASNYPDSGNELHNGVLPPDSYNDPGWIGWNAGTPQALLTYTAQVTPASIGLYLKGGGDGSITLPSQIVVESSNDASTWTAAGNLTIPSDGPTGWQDVPVTGSARYWRLTLTRRDQWAFAAEGRAQ